MSTVLRRGTSRAAAAAVALLGSSLALLPAPSAQATVTGTVTGGAVQWKISDYLSSDTFGRPVPLPSAYTAPASFDTTARTSTWGGGSAPSLAADGAAETAFQGTSVNYTSTSGGWIRFTGPQVSVDASGNGVLTAEISYGTSATTYDPASVPVRGPERIDVMELSGNTAAQLSATPAKVTWAGLTGTWSPELLDFVDGDAAATPTPIPAWSHASAFNVASGAIREPAPVTVSIDRATPQVTVSTTATDPTAGVTLRVVGDGFRGVTKTSPPPSDNGVYVGLAPVGGLPDVSSQSGMASFAASAYVPAAAMTSGAIAATLTAAPGKLDPTKGYAVYTWQAHTHSNTSQDTVTPVTINWEALKHASSVDAGWKKKPKTAKVKGKLAVAVTGTGATPTGEVTLTLARKGQQKTKIITATLLDGKVVVKLPRLKKGTWTVTVAYAGDSAFQVSTTELKVKVKAPKRTT